MSADEKRLAIGRRYYARWPEKFKAMREARSPEKVSAYLAKYRARNLAIVVAELERRGGHCVHPDCAESRVDWHHRDPATKEFNIGRAHSVSAVRLLAELQKCDPLCRKHHKAAEQILADDAEA